LFPSILDKFYTQKLCEKYWKLLAKTQHNGVSQIPCHAFCSVPASLPSPLAVISLNLYVDVKLKKTVLKSFGLVEEGKKEDSGIRWH